MSLFLFISYTMIGQKDSEREGRGQERERGKRRTGKKRRMRKGKTNYESGIHYYSGSCNRTSYFSKTNGLGRSVVSQLDAKTATGK